MKTYITLRAKHHSHTAVSSPEDHPGNLWCLPCHYFTTDTNLAICILTCVHIKEDRFVANVSCKTVLALFKVKHRATGVLHLQEAAVSFLLQKGRADLQWPAGRTSWGAVNGQWGSAHCCQKPWTSNMSKIPYFERRCIYLETEISCKHSKSTLNYLLGQRTT